MIKQNINIMNLGLAIKTIREQKGLRQGVFADHIGVTQSYLSGLENNNKKPSMEVFERISKFSNVPLPVMMWFSVEREDVAENKKQIFDLLKPSVDSLIKEIFNSSI